MPAEKTEVTEVVTGLAFFGGSSLAAALASPPDSFVNVPADTWERLARLEREGRFRAEFEAAWANGRAFLGARAGLRGRVPVLVEWKGGQRAPGDEVVPADLRVDHVYLVSCKYLSKILINASPAHLFERALAGGHGLRGADWYADVAPDAYQALFGQVRGELPPDLGLPPFAADITADHRKILKHWLPAGRWSTAAEALYRQFAAEVARVSAARWKAALSTKRAREAMLWRLLRIGSAPYFVLGSSGDRSVRLRVATPWDWRQEFDLAGFEVWADDAGQPVVRWRGEVRGRRGGEEARVEGHVQVRWSHGRFAQSPEAKVYLDTPHHRVPGYFPLE